ncbi:hypothetical protein F4802DRAFT_600492 [Xylaria palmicola]|nr:hypothetical protein F4802DRAFT_600492 [Xylaria palmicola]
MRFEIFQIALVTFAGFTAAAPVSTSQDAVEKRLKPANPYPFADRIPIGPEGKRELPPPYASLYRSIAKTDSTEALS